MVRALLALSLFFIPFTTLAQSFSSTEPFSLSVSPDYPAPYSKAVLMPISNLVDLTNATITVSVNDKQLYQGSAQSLAIPLGAAGTLTTIKVVALAGGKTYTKTVSLRPQDIALVVEPVASAPVLYPGKPLVPLEGSVRVIAVANVKNAKGVRIDPAQLSYSWSVDSTRIANSSGIGRDALMVASPLQYRSRTVSVVVQSQDGTVASGASLTISPQEPIIRLYESDPLLGVLFDRAITGSFAVTSAEKSLYAAPYSFPTTKGAPLLKWFLNGSAAQTGNSITLRPTGSGQGTASLSLVGTAGNAVTDTTNLSLSFGAAKGGFGIFGL